MSEHSDVLQRTALFDEHRAAGARLVPFAGWEMPVQYTGVIEESRAVRENCGVFDVSHMGQLDVVGAHSTEALNRIISSDWSRVQAGRVAYALLLNEQGGVQDDVMGYHLRPGEWFIVVNASRADVDEAHFQKHLGQHEVRNRYTHQAMLAVQGPRAQQVLQPLVDVDLSAMKWRDCVQSGSFVVARGGYTGSDGFEIMFEANDAPRIWRGLLENGATPCGLGARDVLRLEAGLPLYGHELREEWTPFESSCAWAVKFDKEEFIGREVLLDKKQPSRRIRALKMEGRAIAREEYPVQQNGQAIGEITSGTLSPTVGSGIALAMLPVALELGDEVQVQVRASSHPARVVQPPFVAHAPK